MSDAVIERLVAERDALRDCLLGIALSDRYRRYPKQHEDGGVRGQSGLRAVRSLTGQHGSYLSDEDVVRLDKEARAMLAASPSVGGWEDISTAPKDGRDILILANGMAIEARYAPGEWGPDIPGEVREYNGPVWVAFDDLTQFEIEEGSLEGGRDHHDSVTHWMPLPPPVSTGSRPQEAVPTEGSGAAVLALKEIIPAVEAYLMSGDDLAQALKRQTWGPALKRARQRAAEGCSSNEGAGK